MNRLFFLMLAALGFSTYAMAQSITVDVPSGYKVVVVPSSVTVPEAISMSATAPQTTVTTAPAYDMLQVLQRGW